MIVSTPQDIYSTDHVIPGKFNAHGRVKYEERGNILWATAVGPFNVELVSALEKVVTNLFQRMESRRPWVSICKFENSALCSREVLDSLTEMMKRLVALKIAATGSAFVLPPDVEGAYLMDPLYARCHREAGIRYESFHSAEMASQWAQSVLNTSHG
jgi:hypothetical protein